MQKWIEIISDNTLVIVDQAQVSAVGVVRVRTITPSWFSRLLGSEPYTYYTFGYYIGGLSEIVYSDTYEEADQQRNLLLGGHHVQKANSKNES